MGEARRLPQRCPCFPLSHVETPSPSRHRPATDIACGVQSKGFGRQHNHLPPLSSCLRWGGAVFTAQLSHLYPPPPPANPRLFSPKPSHLTGQLPPPADPHLAGVPPDRGVGNRRGVAARRVGREPSLAACHGGTVGSAAGRWPLRRCVSNPAAARGCACERAMAQRLGGCTGMRGSVVVCVEGWLTVGCLGRAALAAAACAAVGGAGCARGCAGWAVGSGRWEGERRRRRVACGVTLLASLPEGFTATASLKEACGHHTRQVRAGVAGRPCHLWGRLGGGG